MIYVIPDAWGRTYNYMQKDSYSEKRNRPYCGGDEQARGVQEKKPEPIIGHWQKKAAAIKEQARTDTYKV